MKVTFDSNVWRKVATPQNFLKDENSKTYFSLREAIDKKKIIPFLSETIFTLEAIDRKERKKFFKSYKPSFTSSISQENGAIQISGTFGPNLTAHKGNNEFLKEHLSDAVRLGFNIIGVPRIAGIVNSEILEQYKYQMQGEELEYYLEWVFKVGERIQDLKAGVYSIEQIGLKYHNGWFVGVGLAPDSEDGNIASAISEWSDGDAVAAHIAIGGNYFCTLDNAKKAGSNSILGDKNVKILEREFNFRKVSPNELMKMINN